MLDFSFSTNLPLERQRDLSTIFCTNGPHIRAFGRSTESMLGTDKRVYSLDGGNLKEFVPLSVRLFSNHLK